jgi:putative transcriptional regulator
MDSLRGQLLIAPPYLADPNFSHSVVLMIQHDEEGAFGVILNRPSGRTIRDVWSELRDTPCGCAQAVHVGGPVTGPLVALHTEPALGDIQVVDGVWCSMSAEKIEEIVRDDRRYVRFYAGYSGWGGGQLEAELQTGSWLTTDATAENVFHTTQEDLWQTVVRRAAGGETFPRMRGDAEGGDPAMN